MVPPADDIDNLAQVGLAELIDVHQYHLSQSAPPSPRRWQKRRVVDAFDHPHHGLPKIAATASSKPQEHSPCGSRSPQSRPSAAYTDASQQRSWKEWFCCDDDHALAAACADCLDCELPDCLNLCDTVLPCDSVGCSAAPSSGVAISCCSAASCDITIAGTCDGVHSSITACFDPSCTESPAAALPIATCCDRPECSEDGGDLCKAGQVECCDQPDCAEFPADCPDCNLPVSSSHSSNRDQACGTVYSSFQELLDCCCCCSAMPDVDHHRTQATQETAAIDVPTLEVNHQRPTAPTSTTSGHATASSSASTRRDSGLVGGGRKALPSETPLSGTALSSERTSISFDASECSPSAAATTMGTPYGAGQGYSWQISTPLGDKTKATPRPSRSSSAAVPTQLYPMDHPYEAASTARPGTVAPLSTGSERQHSHPQSHASSGTSPPASWAFCGSLPCDTLDPHSHWLPAQQAVPGHMGLSNQDQQRGSVRALPQWDARPQQCQWGGCNERFWTVEELVAHVNHAHLAKRPVVANPASSAPPTTPTTSNGWQYGAPVASLPVEQHGLGNMTGFSAPPSAAAAMPCMWSDCHSVSFSDGDVQLDGLAEMLRDAGMHLPASIEAINDKASAVMLQHLLTVHLGQPMALHGPSGQSLEPPSTEASTPTQVVASGKRSRSPSDAAAELAVASKVAKRKLNVADDGAPTSTAAEEGAAADCCCDNVKVGADGQTGYVCGWEGCGRPFFNHQSLTEHITSEHVGGGKAIYECRWVGCPRFHSGRQFTQKQKVLRHIQTHTGDRPFKCTECGRRFSEPNSLAQHMRTHTQERPYVCDFPGCGKAFSVSGSLTIHKRIHSGAKPFVCKFQGCGKAFAESSNLTKHMRVHSGEKPFRCTECGKRFSRPDQVARHRKTHERKRSGADG